MKYLRAVLMCIKNVSIVFIPQALFDEYPKAFIVNADNVGSKQMQQIRAALRGKAGNFFSLFLLLYI